ncbi:MAG: flagellar type III secretion system pore protein FliP [Eubacteriales bacterium]|nr:flagellar type III secretion system pore protein FliP [Eubacteriales bacterium]
MKKNSPRRVKRKTGRLLRVLCIAQLVLILMVSAIGCVSQADIDAALSAQAETADTEMPSATEGITDPQDELTDEEFLEGEQAETEEDPTVLGQLTELLGSRSASVRIIVLLTLLSIAPSLLIMLTCFVRIIMVLGFTRNALGLQQMPPNQVLIGFALILTLFVMSPVIDQIKTEAYIPYVLEQIDLEEAVERGSGPLREFMLRQTRADDLGMFFRFTGEEIPEDVMDSPMKIVIPAFLTSEFRRAFEIGFFIYIPFIVIDMIVASTLMSMGMMMLPPITISLPFKVLLFVVADGWSLTVQSLLSSFG